MTKPFTVQTKPIIEFDRSYAKKAAIYGGLLIF